MGKTVGISVSALLALRFGSGTLPEGMKRVQVWGVASLGGIGFTVSLFITDLAFTDLSLVDGAKVGIFIGSIASAILGTILLLKTRDRRSEAPPTPVD